MTAQLHHGDDWVVVETDEDHVTLWIEEASRQRFGKMTTVLMLYAQDGTVEHPHVDGDADAVIPWRVFDARVSSLLRRKTHVETTLADDVDAGDGYQRNFDDPLVYDPASGELVHTAACGQETLLYASDVKEAIRLLRAIVKRREAKTAAAA